MISHESYSIHDGHSPQGLSEGRRAGRDSLQSLIRCGGAPSGTAAFIIYADKEGSIPLHIGYYDFHGSGANSGLCSFLQSLFLHLTGNLSCYLKRRDFVALLNISWIHTFQVRRWYLLRENKVFIVTITPA